MDLALTRAVSPRITECVVSFQQREVIDVALAREQHARYEQYLREQGVRVISLPAEADLPDSVFVEDTAVVVDEIAVLARPPLESRRREVASIAAALAPYRPQMALSRTATLEGGDVLRIGRTLYVGRSTRTNAEGIRQLAEALRPFAYDVRAVTVGGCLHLKSAVTYIGDNTVLANTAWVDLATFDDYEVIAVAPTEPHAANALLLGGEVLLPASFPRTCAQLEERGFRVQSIDVSELQKAEAGLTCCSILFA